MTSYRINFTKVALSSIASPKKGRDYYYDLKERSLILDVTVGGQKNFYIYKKVNGRPLRVKLGPFPELSIENARKKALALKNEIFQGVNPNEEKKKLNREITFGNMFREFMEKYSKQNKKTWRHDELEVNRFCSGWFHKRASNISKDEIQKLHEKIKDENGLYQANRLLERIRAIYNKAIHWGWNGVNPALGIKKFKEKSRDRFLQADELPRFFLALAEEENSTARDYILMSLLTGARKSNVLSMQWKDVNLVAQIWRIPETKNGEALTIPLMKEAIELLNNRKNENQFVCSKFVFPSRGHEGHLADPKKAWKRILNRAGIENVRLHDLRRTLGSWQAATGATTAIIGKSLGHKSQQTTAIYERLNIDPIRNSMERATSAMLAYKDKIHKKDVDIKSH